MTGRFSVGLAAHPLEFDREPFIMRRSLALIAALALALAYPPNPIVPGDGFPWRDGYRVVFIGDSITQAGLYVQDIEAYLYTRFPDRHYQIFNLGLSAETASGLTEPDFGRPRPVILDRIDRIIDQTHPHLVVVCYGMNDGIYHPPAPERLEAYEKGMDQVVDRIKRTGADFLILTPPPFDARPIADRVRPESFKPFGYRHPFEGYDRVLTGYADWLVAKRVDGWTVIDVHSAMNRSIASIASTGARDTVIPDGVHPDPTGHWLIAQEILNAWDVPGEVESATVDVEGRKPTTGSITLKRDGTTVLLSWITRIPMPHDPNWDPRLTRSLKIDERFNRHRLVVTGLERPRYALFEGSTKLGDFTREQLADGINLVGLPELSTNQRASTLRGLVAERHRIVNLARLEAVGHPPPRLEKVLPLDEAEKQAEILENRIRELARPIPISLILRPVDLK
jgi:lysophospholipase L1-like esterase